MKRRMIFFSIVLLVSLGLTLVPHTFGQIGQNTFGQVEQNIKILNYSYYFDQDGYFEVVGEVQNVGNDTLNPVFLTGSVISASGTDLSDSYTNLLVTDLFPQEIAPFDMEFMPIDQNGNSWGASDIGSIIINVGEANTTSSYQYTGLTIISSAGTVGTSGNYSGACLVDGVIQNTGSQTAQNVSVSAAFYNSSGTVVAIGYNTAFITYSLAPSATLSFQVPAYDLNQSAVPSSEIISSYLVIPQDEGPIIQGTPPAFVSDPSAQGSVTQTGGSSPTSPPTSSPTATQTGSNSPTSSPSSSLAPTKSTGNASANSLNPMPIVIIVVVIVIVVAVGAIVASRMIKPKGKTQQKLKRKRSSKSS